MNILSAWEKAQDEIKKRVGDTSYETWFTTLQVKEKDGGCLLIEAPDSFFKGWVAEHYQDCILDVVGDLTQSEVMLEFAVGEQVIEKDTKEKYTHLEKEFNQNKGSQENLNAKYTFDNFVVGPANRFSAAAGLAVAESPAKAYNPLFIYGQVGLGKTHLIQAITHKIEQLHPELKCCYISSEQFTNELINAIRYRSTENFRKKYRNMDVLLIDDIQFIAGKESTQEEFFHTFNNLHINHKQIIITSDRPPKEISNLEERLSSRFAWGLITDIQPPDFESRVAILKKKLADDPANIPDEVIYFIAEQIKTNIRELEGALIRVIAYSLLEDKPINLEIAKTVLKDMVKETSKTISVEMIQKTVCEFYNVSLTEIKAKNRQKNIVLARQMAMYLSRQLTNLSLPEIGGAFGGKDHTTVLHACKKIDLSIKDNKTIETDALKLATGLKQ